MRRGIFLSTPISPKSLQSSPCLVLFDRTVNDTAILGVPRQTGRHASPIHYHEQGINPTYFYALTALSDTKSVMCGPKGVDEVTA